MPDTTANEVDDTVRRWTNTKLSWRDNPIGTPRALRPGSVGLSDMTDQMNIATMEILGLLGRHDPVWWESLAELANMASQQIRKTGA